MSNEPTGNVEDGLPTYRDSLGRIKTPERTMDMLLQRVPREDGVFIWKFSNRTVAEIPHLYEHFAHHGIDLAGHDAGPRLRRGDVDLSDAAPRPAAQ